MRSFLLLLVLSAPFALIGVLVAVLSIFIGNRTNRPK
jgi:hypothetical protein